MNLDGREVGKMQEAMASAFPTQPKLEQMLWVRMNVRLNLVAGGNNYRDVLYDLIRWAESEGRTKELLEQARAENPRNDDLKRFAERYPARSAGPPPVNRPVHDALEGGDHPPFPGSASCGAVRPVCDPRRAVP